MLEDKETQERIDKTRCAWGDIFSSIKNVRDSWISAWYEITDKQSWIDEEENRLQGIEKEVQRARRELAYRASTQIPQPTPVETPHD